jgi:ribonuclease R
MKRNKNNNHSKNRRPDNWDDKTPDAPQDRAPPRRGLFGAAKPAPAKTSDWRDSDPDFAAESTRYASPLPSRNLILRTLADAPEPLTLDELIARFGLLKLNEQEAFTKRLVAMAREGQVTPADRRGAYRAILTDEGKPVEAPSRRVETIDGKVSAHRDGFGFVIPEVRDPDGGPNQDIFLSPRQMNGLMNGDRVRVRVTGTDNRGRREGQLVSVIERGTTQVVGRLHGKDGVFTVIPSNPKNPEIIIPAADRGGAKPGQMVVAALVTPPSDRSLPVGKITEILGEHMAPGMEITAAIRAHKLPHEWPEGVEAEAAAFGPEVKPAQWAGREDLRDLGLMTIDGADARDFDDAVYAESIKGWRGGGWKLWVAIADVSAYVTPGSALDAEAIERGTSVYFPNNVIPMLPEALSNGLCSLNPNVDRLCMVAEMRIAKDGEISKARFFPAVMRSEARLIYEDVAEMLAQPDGEKARAHPQLIKPLQTLHAVFEALFKAREKRGAIDFEGTETKIVFGEGRKIEKIVPVQRNVAHRLIEECMIAANVESAKLVEKHSMPALYRCHAEPDAAKVAILREFLAGRALKLGGGSTPAAGDYAKLLSSLKGREDAGLIQMVMLRSLMQARYQPDNTGHFGLALTHYAHFTSPIRRYPDLLLHRAIKHVLVKGKPKTFGYTVQQMEALGVHCSMAERRADDATRDVNTWLKCEFMQHRVGEELDGLVSSVASFGLFVELDGLYIEGMVHISNLKGDYYEFDAKHQRLTGQRSHQVYGLGQKVRVKVVRVSLDERKIDLELVEGGNRGASGAGGGRGGRHEASSGKGRSSDGAAKKNAAPVQTDDGGGPRRKRRRR